MNKVLILLLFLLISILFFTILEIKKYVNNKNEEKIEDFEKKFRKDIEEIKAVRNTYKLGDEFKEKLKKKLDEEYYKKDNKKEYKNFRRK